MGREIGTVVWLTGLPSSGKTTLARRVQAGLRALGRPALVLDGDELRGALVPTPGHDDAARADVYETLARLAALVAAQGLDVLVPATAHRQHFRDRARRRAPRFLEVHVATPLAECRARDDKGLYARAAEGEVATLPGVGVDYEPPLAADVTATGGEDEAACDEIVRRLAER